MLIYNGVLSIEERLQKLCSIIRRFEFITEHVLSLHRISTDLWKHHPSIATASTLYLIIIIHIVLVHLILGGRVRLFVAVGRGVCIVFELRHIITIVSMGWKKMGLLNKLLLLLLLGTLLM